MTTTTKDADQNDSGTISERKTINAAMRPLEVDCSTPQQFRLLDLPAELVVRILDFAVVISSKQNPIDVEAKNMTEIRPPAISRTCRLLRSEAVPLFYARNVFLGSGGCETIKNFWRWLHGIGSANASRIKSLYMTMTDHDDTPWGLDSIEWSDMHVELAYQRHAADHADIVADKAHIRMWEGKVLVWHAPKDRICYQISLQPRSSSEHWRSLKSFPRCETYDSDSCDGHGCQVVEDSTDSMVEEGACWAEQIASAGE